MLRQPSFAGAIIDVGAGIDAAHRALAQPFLVRVRDQTWNAGDDEQRVPELAVDTEIAADAGDGAVDVDVNVFR